MSEPTPEQLLDAALTRVRKMQSVGASLLSQGSAAVKEIEAAKAGLATPVPEVPVEPEPPVVTPPAQPGLLDLRPQLVDPTTVVVTSANCGRLGLQPDRDYVLVIKDGFLNVGSGRLSLGGGRNVVLVGGEVRAAADNGRPIEIKRITGSPGTIYIEGLKQSNDGGHSEGMNLDIRAPGTHVVLVSCDQELISGTQAGHHADNLQFWGGNDGGSITVYRCHWRSNYQNIMGQPGQFGYAGPNFRVNLWDTLLEKVGDGGIPVYMVDGDNGVGMYRVDARNLVIAWGDRTSLTNSVWNGQSLILDKAGVRVGATDLASPLIGTPGREYVSPFTA